MGLFGQRRAATPQEDAFGKVVTFYRTVGASTLDPESQTHWAGETPRDRWGEAMSLCVDNLLEIDAPRMHGIVQAEIVLAGARPKMLDYLQNSLMDWIEANGHSEGWQPTYRAALASCG